MSATGIMQDKFLFCLFIEIMKQVTSNNNNNAVKCPQDWYLQIRRSKGKTEEQKIISAG